MEHGFSFRRPARVTEGACIPAVSECPEHGAGNRTSGPPKHTTSSCPLNVAFLSRSTSSHVLTTASSSRSMLSMKDLEAMTSMPPMVPRLAQRASIQVVPAHLLDDLPPPTCLPRPALRAHEGRLLLRRFRTHFEGAWACWEEGPDPKDCADVPRCAGLRTRGSAVRGRGSSRPSAGARRRGRRGGGVAEEDYPHSLVVRGRRIPRSHRGAMLSRRDLAAATSGSGSATVSATRRRAVARARGSSGAAAPPLGPGVEGSAVRPRFVPRSGASRPVRLTPGLSFWASRASTIGFLIRRSQVRALPGVPRQPRGNAGGCAQALRVCSPSTNSIPGSSEGPTL